MQRSLLFLFAAIPFMAFGQTYYYINSISVDPLAPTTSDNITLTLHGDLSNTAAVVVSANATVVGNTVQVDVIADQQGIGLSVLVPHDELLPIGQLPAGTYTITISGPGTSDFAPVPDHTFTVAGGGSPCDSVAILEVRYNAFDSSLIDLHVQNTSSVLFDYPGFILFDQNGDTLAKEVVNFFGIGQDQWHALAVHPGAVMPQGVFNGTIELWTLFYADLGCEFAFNGALCPPPPCSMLMAEFMNTGGALVVASVPFAITDGIGNTVASGTFDLTNNQQYVVDTLCLPAGEYTITVSYPTPLGGQCQFYLGTENDFQNTPAQSFPGGSDVSYDFQFYMPCSDGTNAIGETGRPEGLMIHQDAERLIIHRADGLALGQVKVMDQQGRVAWAQHTSAAGCAMDVSRLATGTYTVTATDGARRLLGRAVIVR